MKDKPAFPDTWRSSRIALILLILLLNVAGFFYYIYYLNEHGYLPSPFVYDKSDTFMDFFNVLYWAYDGGRYIEWGAVYPPLNFLIIRGLNYLFMGAGLGDPVIMRENSRGVIYGFLFIYLTVPLLILKIRQWDFFSLPEKVLIYFSIILSAPMLFSLERGNLIIFCPFVLALAVSTVGFTRCLFVAILINFKPYFIILAIYYLIRRNWKGFFTCVTLAGTIFIISGLVLDNNLFVFFENVLSFSKEKTLFSLREVLAFPSSISVFSYVLSHPDGLAVAAEVLEPQSIEYLIAIMEAIKWVALAVAMATLVFKFRLIRDAEVFLVLVVAISNLGIWVGGYTLILYVALIPVLIDMQNRRIYLVCLVLLALPLDLIVMLNDYIGRQYSYFAAENVDVFWQFGAGSFVRPVINLTLLLILSCELIVRSSKPKPMVGKIMSLRPSTIIFNK